MKHRAMSSASGDRRPGYVIFAVLGVIVVLSLAAYQFTELMTSEYRAASRMADAAQARLAAVSGIHYAAAMLADPNSFYDQLNADPFSDGAFSEQVVRAGGANSGPEARFSLVTVAVTGSGSYEQRYGAVTDEGGKLNINALIALDPSGQLLYSALMQLAAVNPNMTSDIAAAIVDWVDADDDPQPGGAESDYYSSLANPYQAKNGPLNSLDELLLVKGVTPQLLYGTDRNRNGLADDDAGGSQTFDRGLADYLTVYGRELNLDSSGMTRDNVNDTEDLPGLYQRLTARVGPALADYILAYKMFSVSSLSSGSSSGGSSSNSTSNSSGNSANSGSGTQQGSAADLSAAVQAALQADSPPQAKRRLKSLFDLYNTQVTLPKVQGAPANAPTVVVASPLTNATTQADLIAALYDQTTATTNIELIPRLNVNTAPREVLMMLTSLGSGSGSASSGSSSSGGSASSSSSSGSVSSSGASSGAPSANTGTGPLAEADVDAIIAQRSNQDPSDPATQSGVWLVTSGVLTPSQYTQIEKYVTGRTMVYRVQAIGYFPQGGPMGRVEAVIDVNRGAPRILYFRDLGDLDTPHGFAPPGQQQ